MFDKPILSSFFGNRQADSSAQPARPPMRPTQAVPVQEQPAQAQPAVAPQASVTPTPTAVAQTPVAQPVPATSQAPATPEAAPVEPAPVAQPITTAPQTPVTPETTPVEPAPMAQPVTAAPQAPVTLETTPVEAVPAMQTQTTNTPQQEVPMASEAAPVTPVAAEQPTNSPQQRPVAAAPADVKPAALEQPAMPVQHAKTSDLNGKDTPVFSNQADQAAGEDGIVHGPNLHDTRFADIWFTPENIAYVRDIRTRFALTPIETPDLPEFRQVLEQGFTGATSYAVRFAGDAYRVERVITNDGVQFNCRKMPTETPEIEALGFSEPIVKHLASLGRSAGLLLFAGPTGQGKTTSASALMKRFLDTEGGFLYTIEDPPEMPLGGLYHAKNGGLGLCKQTAVENDQWGACLRSALRSKPRYILVGEIRTPETASQCLVAATSGHLVLSTIHANGVEDALNSIIKYAASTGLDEGLVADLLARGILGVIYQRLEGVEKLQLYYQTAFANPNTSAADQMRMAIRDGSINLATFMETQNTRLVKGLPLFRT